MTPLHLFAATPKPTLPPINVNPDLVTPNWIGFAITFLVTIAVIALIVDMVRRIRRINYRNMAREKLDAEEQAAREAAETDHPEESGS